MVYYGIDLGTTYSCIAKVDEQGDASAIKNLEGKYTTPSVVLFNSTTDAPAGDVAKSQAGLYPDLIAEFVKRRIGMPNADYTFHGQTFTPEQISSFILRKLVKDAEAKQDGKIKDVVITVPAYFGNAQKEATKAAGKLAGLNVLALINEPTAAAYYHYSTKEKLDGRKRVLVYDLGGGTFDVTIADIFAPDDIQVIATSGDHTLGGKDWDDRLIGYFLSKYCEETGIDRKDVEGDAETYQQLRRETEDAKITLTSAPKAGVTINMGPGKKKRVEATLEQFDEITKPLLNQTWDLIESALSEASVKTDFKGKDLKEMIDEVLFVGGSTRMRQVEALIKEKFGLVPKLGDPDEDVARGAALYAKYLSENPQPEPGSVGETDRRMLDSGPIRECAVKNYGIVAIIDGVSKISNIIIKNDPVMVAKTETYYTMAKNQATVRLAVYESPEMAEYTAIIDGTPIWKRTEGVSAESDPNTPYLKLPPGLDKDSPLEVTFMLDLSGILTVSAIETTHGQSCQFTLTTNAISEERVEELTGVTLGVKVSESETSVTQEQATDGEGRPTRNEAAAFKV